MHELACVSGKKIPVFTPRRFELLWQRFSFIGMRMNILCTDSVTSGIAAAYRLGANYVKFDDFAEDFFSKYCKYTTQFSTETLHWLDRSNSAAQYSHI